jgi:hypothetical protein
MRVGLINVARLTRVRRTFRYQWRIFIIFTFSFLAFAWWGAFNRVQRVQQIASDDRLQRRLVILALVLLPLLGVAFFKKNGFARLTFALITSFTLLNLFPLALVSVIVLIPMLPWKDPNVMFFVVLGALAAPMFFWDFLIAHAFVLFLSVTPFGRGKAFRNQVVSSLLLWSGHWKSRDDAAVVEPGERLHPSAGARYRLMIGGVWIIVAIICLLMAGYSMFNSEFMPALFHLQFAKAWYMVRHFQLTEPSELGISVTIFQIIPTVCLGMLGLGCFAVFGYFLSQWRRENTLVFRRPILQHLTSFDVLLLRTFDDDVKYVGREQSPWAWMVLVKAMMWTYTFEELIVNRLSYLGKVRLLDIDPEIEELTENWWLKKVSEKERLKRFMQKQWMEKLVASQRLKRFLISVFPVLWYKLPSQGGIRYYVDKEEKVWKEQVVKAMYTARMIIVLLGTTESLIWEMEQIQKHNFSEKTVFVMPPVRWKRNYRPRWQQFIRYLNDSGVVDIEPLKKVKPHRVRAVCVHRDMLLVVTGKSKTKLFYEAALDIATLFTVAEPAHSRRMIYKYLT